ncbi:MAG TPA: polysaccharide deacetylase family protein [Propionicimonas sp.]|nr:polysaccharide deacetylase family protein [Propionicimonas sp.]HQA78369.1 polysaccharide deacetylase family protein [Propionicimonas sp.]HQD97832.1 polysaccharide deacetylase family protein [Propionicimonas sp.]
MKSAGRAALAATVVALLFSGCATVPPRTLAARAAESIPPSQVNAVVGFPLPTRPVASPLVAGSDAAAPVDSAATDPSAVPSPAEPTGPATEPPAEPPAPEPEPPAEPAPVDCAVLKCVALTMDDGPVPGTGKLLDLFARRGVKATFFLLGQNAKAHPKLVRRMVAEGHELGNHSWSHPEFWNLSKSGIRKQLVKTNKLLTKLGQRPKLVRPPYGEWDRDVAKVTRSLGMPAVIWDVDPEDWKVRKAKTVAKRVLKQVERGSIILTHDSLKSTRKAIPAIVRGLQAKGYTLVTVSQLMAGKLHPGKRCFHA